MEMWHQLYRDTRRHIEISGKGARWEFDQKLLFTKTDYIGEVAGDLGNVIQVRGVTKNVNILLSNAYFLLFDAWCTLPLKVHMEFCVIHNINWIQL